MNQIKFRPIKNKMFFKWALYPFVDMKLESYYCFERQERAGILVRIALGSMWSSHEATIQFS